MGNSTTVDWRVIDDLRPLAAAMHRPGAEIANSDIDTFQRDGVVYLPGAFTEWVEPLRAGLERNLQHPDRYAFPCESTRANEPGRFFDSYCNWQLIPEYLSFVMTSKAAAIAAVLMRSDTAQLYHEHAFCKEVGTTKPTPWHQDLPYYCVDGPQTASVYVALDDIPAEIAVKFVAGSHLDGKLYYPRNFAEGRNYVSDDPTMAPVPDIDATVHSCPRPSRRRHDRVRLPHLARQRQCAGGGTATSVLHTLARRRLVVLPAARRDITTAHGPRYRAGRTHARRLVPGAVAEQFARLNGHPA